MTSTQQSTDHPAPQTAAPADSSLGPALEFEYVGLETDPPAQSDYQELWDYQRAVHARVSAGEIPPRVLFVQHSPVYTAGRRTLPEERPFDNTPVVDVDRGGKITYHGPGQLVGYPIIPLPRRIGPLGYVRRVEEALIRCLADFGVHGIRVDGRTGVWLPATSSRLERKIAAIGIRVSRQTAMHGFALNVAAGSTGPFHNIVPCGISDADVTSLQDETGVVPPSLAAMGRRLEPYLTELLAWQPYEPLGGSTGRMER
ncbi:lipoyl(octanoyl) transferase LipB [Nigerium massiliense]|uniref:lipoyl(octanoyl) transferase LipB n=1 Tax=Nigerium massiliense TaxID=1522317 RepID=UPI0009E2E8DF|nr:lipoyl(octanoyl) transferase LipB [Nigerium massiliense]